MIAKIKTKSPYSKMICSSKRLIIRPYKMTDLKLCREAKEKRLKKINKFDDEVPICRDLSKENFKSKLAGYKERAKDRQHFVFGIFTKRTGEHIGAVDIYIINHEIKWGNLGYQIHNHHWGNGFATEASVITLKLSIKELGLHRVEAATEVRNYAARKVALKAGMVYEGRRKNFFENVDYVVFGANSLMMFPTREKMGSSKK